MRFKAYFLVGGAGFIGSHFIDALLEQSGVEKVTIYDNFSSGKVWHYAHHLKDPRFAVIRGDVKDAALLTQSMAGHTAVMHFASNPDIAAAAKNPGVDFQEGIFLTWQVLESARLTKVQRIIYISGSGVYGDVGELESHEDQGGLVPISTYGASKLGGEAFLASYCHMFGMTARVFRLGNAVGPRQTHGVAYDFIRSLFRNPHTLQILGDGSQSKSYIHVRDIVDAILLANEDAKYGTVAPYAVYNVATGDYITVREIAEIIVDCMALQHPVTFEYTGGDRGWRGDVPVVRLNTERIRSLGWTCKRGSAEAIRESSEAIIRHVADGLIT